MRKLHAAILILLALLSIGGATLLWPKAFPTATIDFKVTPAEVKTRIESFVEAQGYPMQGYHSATSFGEDSGTTRFIELEYGIPKLEQLTQEGLNVWYWSVRWFKPQQHEEFGASLDPQGRIVGFSHTIEEEKAIPSLDKEAARQVAEAFLKKFITQHPWEKLHQVSDSSEERPHRTDYSFIWERDDFRLGEAPYRLEVTVKGNQVGGYNEYLKIPERWTRDFEKKRETNNLCMSIASAALMAIVVGYFVILILSIRDRKLRWRNALPWGWFALFAGVEILAKLNSIPELLAAYQTTENWHTFIGHHLSSTIQGVLFTLGALWFLALVADALYREKLPGHLSVRQSLGIEGLGDARTVRSLFIGVIFAIVSVAYVSGFYVLGRKCGVWAPVDIDYAKTLSGWFPWISPIQTGLTAAFGEEMLFRVVGLIVIWKVVRVRWIAVVLSAATWAFLHSNYPQMPGYARGIELTLVGIVWSVLLLRYGLLTTLTAHYLYDCWLGDMVVFQSASCADRAGALVGSGWPIAILGISWWLYHRNGKKALLPEPTDAHPAPPSVAVAADPLPTSSFGTISLSSRQKGLVCIAALLTILVCFKLPAPQDTLQALGKLDLPRSAIAAAADREVRQRGFDPARYHQIITCNGGSTRLDYLLEKGSYAQETRLFQTELPDVYWYVRYFRVLEKEELRLELNPQGQMIRWNHAIPREAKGASLTREAALALAKKALTEQYGVDLSREKLVSQDSNRQEHRLDYSFEFERTDWHWGEALLRTSINLKGDEPGGFNRYVKVPEAWLLERQKSGWKKFVAGEFNSWLGLAQGILVLSLFILLVSKRMVPWRQAFLIALIPAAIKIAMLLNKTPWFYADYKTTMALANYLATHWLTLILGTALGYLGQTLFIGVGLGFVRWAFGWELKHLILWPRDREERAEFWTTSLSSVLAAYALLFAISNFEEILNGFFLPTASGTFQLPHVNSTVPWLHVLLSSANQGLEQIVFLAVAGSVVILLYRRFPRLTLIVVPLYPVLGAIQHDSWAGFFCSAATGELRLALVFFLVWRVFRFNAMALWLTYFLWALIPNALTYATHGGAGYQRQFIPLTLAVVLPLLIGWIAHRSQADADKGEPVAVGAETSSDGPAPL
jgi:membrane protease YdiL (CAAX protease family)